MQLADHIERRLRPGRIGLLIRVGAVDEAAPAIDRRIDLAAAASEQQRVAAARAEADGTDFAGRAGHPSQIVGRGLEILQRLGVGQPEHDRPDIVHIVRVLRRAAPPIKRRGAGVVADIGEAPGQVADVIDKPESLLDHNDAGVVAGLVRLRDISRDIAAAARQRDDPALDAAGVGDDAGYVRHGALPRLEFDNNGRQRLGHRGWPGRPAPVPTPNCG